ncbi:MAG: response regulator [Deltaproteobacteria bacterium]|jgi:putative two-component system response regulator|nr:response regulator [Deltaproteobacteria bacterium]
MDSRRQKIMLVDDNMANLAIGKNMLKEFYEVFPIPSGVKLFEVLEHVTPALILLDVMMPEMDGYEAIRRLKADPRWVDTPVIFLTSKNDERSELEGLSLGAIDYVAKPFSAPLLLKRIENQLLISSQKKELVNYNDNLQLMVEAKTHQVVELQNAVLSTVAEMVEFRDNMTGGHVFRTQKYLEVLLNKLLESGIYRDEVSQWNQLFLLPSAQLHDVGKIAISDTILNKPGKLTSEEFEIMKKHTVIGVQAIEKISSKTAEHAFLKHAGIFAGTHHEKWDGTGYPYGLSGEGIPLEGRLMAVADVYDALISKRPYKPPLTTADAERIIIEGRGTHFDPALIDVFRQVANQFAEIAALNDE